MTKDDSSDTTPAGTSLTPRHLTKQEFGRRVYELMLARGWHQAELGRRSGIPRDAIGTYIRGRNFPSPANLEALARALNVAPQALLPNHTEAAIREDSPAFEMKVSPTNPSVAWLRVDRLVSLKTAVKVAELLEADDAVANRK